MIRAIIIDRDGVCNHHSSDPSSPFYYITCIRDLVLKPNVREAFELLNSLQKARGLKVYLATKQRCISKGLVTRTQVNEINKRLEMALGFQFDGIYVEESAPDKRALFSSIFSDSGVRSDEMMLLDDSAEEFLAWQDTVRGLGQVIGTEWSLYDAICYAYAIT